MIRDVVKAVLRTVVQLAYRVRVQGDLAALHNQDRALIIANHESWLDGAILALFVPGDPVFVVNTGIARKPVFKLALRLVEHLAVDPANPLAMKRVVELLKSGRRVVIFPEGRLTTTGALMKVYDGPAFAALRSEASLVPLGLTGTGWSRFTRLEGHHPQQWFPQITLTVQAPKALSVPEGLPARERRHRAGESLRLVMQELAFARTPLTTLFNGFVQAARLYGRQRPIMTDVRQLTDESQPDYRYNDLLKMACGLGRLLLKVTQPGECVGLLMPNMAATLGLLLGASAHGRLPAMLNYKAGVQGLLDACTAAAIQTVVTSRAFIAKGNLEAEAHALEQAGLRLVYLEDLRAQFTLRDKLGVIRDLCWPDRVQVPTDIEAPAVVLFTSGSEGKPKGVVLSHRAIMANIAQVRAVFDFNTDDRALNALPIFHSFGLTGGTLLPLMCGIHLLLYASPLHFRIIRVNWHTIATSPCCSAPTLFWPTTAGTPTPTISFACATSSPAPKNSPRPCAWPGSRSSASASWKGMGPRKPLRCSRSTRPRPTAWEPWASSCPPSSTSSCPCPASRALAPCTSRAPISCRDTCATSARACSSRPPPSWVRAGTPPGTSCGWRTAS